MPKSGVADKPLRSNVDELEPPKGNDLPGPHAVPNNNNFDILHQTGKLEKDINGFYRTSDLGTHSSISELMQSGALPGTQGVTLTDRTVRFGDLYDLGTLDGRKIEFSLTTAKFQKIGKR